MPQFSLKAQRFFDHEIQRKSCLWAALIYSLPIFHFPDPFQTPTQLCHRIELIRTIPMIYILPLYLFWKARYGTCRLFLYTFLLGNPFESGYVGYETWGRVSIEDVGKYRNGPLRIKFKILLASKLGPLSSGHFHLLD